MTGRKGKTLRTPWNETLEFPAEDQVDVALLVFLVGALKNYFNLTPVQIGYLSSMTFLGQLVGNLLIGSIADLYGRRIAFQATMVIWGAASFMAAGAWDVT